MEKASKKDRRAGEGEIRKSARIIHPTTTTTRTTTHPAVAAATTTDTTTTRKIIITSPVIEGGAVHAQFSRGEIEIINAAAVCLGDDRKHHHAPGNATATAESKINPAHPTIEVARQPTIPTTRAEEAEGGEEGEGEEEAGEAEEEAEEIKKNNTTKSKKENKTTSTTTTTRRKTTTINYHQSIGNLPIPTSQLIWLLC